MDKDLEQSDERLDERLKAHLSSELDGQLGRSVSHFRRHAGAAQGSDGPETLSYAAARSSWSRRGSWMLGVAGSAMAAALAVLFIVPGLRQLPQPKPTPIHRFDPIQVINVGEIIRSGPYYDGGTFVSPDGVPMRRWHRVNLHERRWRDAENGAEIEQLMPSEEELLLELKTY